MFCCIHRVGVCVFEGVFVRKSEKIYEKALPCAHISVFQGRCTRKKVARIALSSFTTFFFTFQKEEREREIDICREDNTY